MTELSVWWLLLGLRLERIEPGKPYQNGRQERLHLTLEEVVGKPSANPRAQQRAIDLWRKDYNEHRPHEALSMRSPVEVYTHSRRRYPCKLIDPRASTSEPDEVYRLDDNGRLRWNKRWIHISSAIGGEYVIVENTRDWMQFSVSFGGVHLGTFRSDALGRGLRIPRRRRRKPGEVATLSLR